MIACSALMNTTPSACAETLSSPAVLSSVIGSGTAARKGQLCEDGSGLAGGMGQPRQLSGRRLGVGSHVSSAANSKPAATSAVTKNPTAPAEMKTDSMVPHCTLAENPHMESAESAKRQRAVE